MDLTQFTNKKSEVKKIKKEIILDNNEIYVCKIGDEIEFELKKETALEKYSDFLFLTTTTKLETDNLDEAQKFFELSIEKGVEGVMVKNPDSPYTSGSRVGAMAKVKETKEDLDVVILGAEHGTGKRAGFYSSFIVAVRNSDEDEVDEENRFLVVGKVSSGIKEIGDDGHSMENLTNLLKPLKLFEEKGLTYFEPKIILQVKYQEIQKSPSYNSGYALRFPRIVMLREDKLLDEINTIDDVIKFS